jgi:hypothetical protein
MKTTRVLLALFSAMVAATIASAQTIQFLFVTKLVDYEQTDASTTGLVTNPYIMAANIDGTGLSGSFPVSPTIAVSSTGSASLITLTTNSDGWHFESTGFANQGALNAVYGSGTYTFQSSSFANSVLNLSNDSLYPNAPVATISTNTGLGLQWSGGVLVVDPSLFTTFTVLTNAFATNFNASSNHIGISGDSFNTNVSAESFNDADGVLSYNIASATFLGGSSGKSLEIEFNNIIDYFANTPGAGNTSVSAFTSVTKISIQVIPEPSTYAAIFGGLALVGVMLHRRRRLA